MSTATTESKAAGHTPGPWEIHGDDLTMIGACDGKAMIAHAVGPLEVHPPEWRRTIEEAAANARLIAAAPAMLAALEDIAGRGPVPGYGSAGALLVRLAGIQSIARAALAAATGEG